jgi:hypothetical protein
MKSLELQIERLKKEAAAVSAKHAADKKAAEQRERSAARDAASAVASAKASATALEQQRVNKAQLALATALERSLNRS